MHILAFEKNNPKLRQLNMLNVSCIFKAESRFNRHRKKDKSKPLWPSVQPQSNSTKENALFAQLPQEIDKCTRTQTPRCQCELILSTLHAMCCRIWRTASAVHPLGLWKAEMRAALAMLTE